MSRQPASTIPALGELEIAVLEHAWSAGETSAKDAHAAIGEQRGISLNTVQSTLERLFRKELLTRTKSGHAFRYSAKIPREQLLARLIHDVIGRFGADTSASLAAFVEAAEDFDEDALSALEAELKQRRERRTK